jgi:hypothetical protein
MTPQEWADIFGPFLGLLGFGGIILAGMKIRYNYLAQTRLHRADKDDVDRLASEVESLRSEVIVMREGLVELGERVDFTERMLARGKPGKAGAALPGPDA